MAGSRLVLESDVGPAQAVLQQLRAQLSDGGRDLLLGDIGEYLVRSARERRTRQVDPDGNPWKALQPAYARRKAKLRPGVGMLKFDDHMLGDQFSWQLDGDAVLVGTNAIYGAVQQEARPWLGLSAEDQEEILAIATDHLAMLRSPGGAGGGN